MVITLTRVQEGIRIDMPVGAGDIAGSRPILHDSSPAQLWARLLTYGYSEGEISLAMKVLEEKGEADLSLPLRCVA